MQIKEKENYSQLYKIVEQNMNISGKNMELSEPICLYSVGEKKNVADILHLWDCLLYTSCNPGCEYKFKKRGAGG